MSTHRGRKPSGKPGASHLAALQAAHGKGDYKAAKSAALNYAKACHAHGSAEEEAEYHAGAMAAAPPAKAPDGRLALARLAMSRKK